MNIKNIAAALAVALSLVTSAAQGALLSFEDDDIDFALNSDLSLKSSGNLAVGDILVSIFEIPIFTIDGANAIPAGQELTGVAAIQIDTIVGNTITFTAVDVGLNAILALGTDPDAAVIQGGAGEGATIAMWFNSAAGADNLIVDRATLLGDASCTSLADCLFEASRGSLLQVDGFSGDPDEFWFALTLPGGQNIGVVAGTSNTTNVALFNAAQTTFFNATGEIGFINTFTGAACAAPGPGVDGCVKGGIISGTISGGQGLTNGAFAHSDFEAQKLQVPEPGTLLLLAAGLLGLGAIRRRS